MQGEPFTKHVEELKEEVKLMLHSVDPLHQLELIDHLERLGVSYHFQDEIKRILKIFDNFRDEKENFRPCLKDNCRGILSMYEAAFLLKEGENAIFDDVRNFTTSYLKEYVKENKDQYLSTLVSHELELPRYWRMIRLEARWFIDVYETRPDMSSIVLEFAKLDFNMVQATHQEDMKYASRKWKKMGLGDQFSSFARDSWMVSFFWAAVMIFEPQYGYFRSMTGLAYALITIMDDVYDVYGTVDELELLTDAVDRLVPEHAIDIIPYLKKSWADLCKAYLLEAKWYKNGYTPTLEEYMANAWISIGAPLHEIARGDAPKSIYCYMHETGASEEEAHEHIQEMIVVAWMKMNRDRLGNPYFAEFVTTAMSISRMSQCVYQYGDGHGIQDTSKDRIMSLFVDPIPLINGDGYKK
ncbi:hypothetical protein Pint_11432 [Pistacia integerrima]|uniref:Uncharacterized protein n=1 Tax=Pistacia integerrima TaxID=434235 RepID=A0ACC0XIG2_9ROSI|nr:hypothetical protein Pint_11432 [Pistacia integerrima]